MPHIKHLSKDRKLAAIIKKAGRFELTKHHNIFIDLCSTIMSQQLSTKVKKIIWQRFLDLFGGKMPTPQQVLDMDFEKLRSIGLSNSKTAYIRNVALFAKEKGMDGKKISRMKNEEVITYLTEIKGVGRWTVEMILMFTLGREDVFAVDDFGIQQAMKGLYNIRWYDRKRLHSKMIGISDSWAPYRTYACMYLWRWKDEK